jgi:hypothetical protein
MPFDANDPETKEAVAALIAEAVGKLETKNRDLIAELRAAKKGREIDPAEVERLEAELEASKAQLADANKQLKAANKAAEDAAKQLDGERGFTSSLVVDGGLRQALMDAGVTNPAHLKAATALLKGAGAIEVKTEADGSRKAYVGDKALGDVAK